MKIVLDQDKCVASGQCVLAAPDVFDQRDDDGIAVLLREHPVAGEEESVREAGRICPAAAIRVEEA
ncbi:ferredoxin [Amycolatopsis carbonis]|uniref:Ferredoxin n=1 Tax=Amycolatopsis carbonis TaxID=715471 RepID=A0A9Y2ICF1_9PSEU|nr:ferredoxin [Amycolatopsis sp. 2-15]WIX76696.1 ferredoxin [Amycolatopsis sp. 2-15]